MSDPILKRYLTLQKRLAEAQESYYCQRSLTCSRNLLRLNFSRNMSALQVLKGNKTAGDIRKELVQDNVFILRSLRGLRRDHPEIFNPQVKQLSFLKELIK